MNVCLHDVRTPPYPYYLAFVSIETDSLSRIFARRCLFVLFPDIRREKQVKNAVRNVEMMSALAVGTVTILHVIEVV